MHISVPHIDDALGHSVIYDEYRGNFVQARQISEARLDEARRQDDPTHLADALLARGIVHLLQGEAEAALTRLAEAEQLVPTDANRQLRAITYSKLARCVRYDTFPSGGQIKDYFSVDDDPAEGEMRERLLTQVSEPTLRLETWLVHDLLCGLSTSRAFLTGTTLVPEDQIKDLLGAALRDVKLFRQRLESQPDPRLAAYADRVLADLCRRAGDSDLAAEYLTQAYNAYTQLEDWAGVGCCHMAWCDWSITPDTTAEAWNCLLGESHREEDGGIPALDPSVPDLASEVESLQSMYAAAQQWFRRANALRGVAAIELRCAYLAMLVRDYATALQRSALASQLFQDAGDVIGFVVARAHHALYQVCVRKALADTDTAKAIGEWAREEGSLSVGLELGQLFARVGEMWLSDGDPERALACYRLAEAVFRGLDVLDQMLAVARDQAQLYDTIGVPSAALSAHLKAQTVAARLYKRHPTVSNWSNLLTSWIPIYAAQMAREDADGLSRVVDQFRADLALPAPAPSGPDDPFVIRTTQKFLGQESRHAEAEVALYRALDAHSSGDTETAQSQFDLALATAREIQTPGGHVLVSRILQEQERYDESTVAIRAYVDLRAQMADPAGSTIGYIEREFGVPLDQSGKGDYKQQTHRTAARAFLGTKAYAEAQQHLRALEQLAGPDWWRRHPEPWEMLGLYGGVSEGLGQLPQALAHYDHAITELEAYRGHLSRDELKVGLANRRYYLYLRATRAALRLSDEARDRGELTQADVYVAQAFDYMERGKARALLDLMAGSVLMAGGRDESQLLSRWRQLDAELGLCHDLLQAQYNRADARPDQIAELEQRVVVGRIALAQVEADLTAAHPGLAEAINPQVEVMSLEAIRQALPPDTLMLVFAFQESIHGEGLMGWGISPETVRHHRSGVDVRLLDRQIVTFHRACAGKAAKVDAGGWLSRTLLGPFAGQLEQHANLIVVPHGSAHSLPFQALPWQGRPLAETHVLSYLPSASALRLLSEKRQRELPKRLLSVGNPSDMAYRLPLTGDLLQPSALPGAEIEATYVASLFDESLVLVGDKATEESVGRHLEGYQVIHLATHGYLSEEGPLLSSLLLANGESLSVYELLGLRLNADLVVLSACETARGEITGGNEVLGLTRGLLAAGAGAAVVSLWPVNDISTSLFMGEFYRRLRGGDAPAAALQGAQCYLRCMAVDRVDAEIERIRAVLQEDGTDTATQGLVDEVRHLRPVDAPPETDPEHPYSHPFFWAPFILVGQ